MKILFVVPYVPNLVRVRPYNLIRLLAARGHQVDLFTLWDNQQEQTDIKKLQQMCHAVHAQPMPRWQSLVNCLAALPSHTPLQAVYSWQPKLAEHIIASIGITNYDIIHIEHLRGSRYGIHIKEKLKKTNHRIPVVWDSVDCISLLFRHATERSQRLLNRFITRLELNRTENFERWLTILYDQVLVTSPTDRQALIDLHTQGNSLPRIDVLSNGVDLDYFTPGEAREREPATLIVSGKMSYHANITMVGYLIQHIMPHIWSARPDVRLQIVGRNPPKEILALGKNPSISVISNVPDIPPYLQKATIALTPILYGVGVQNKVLEAMACATPVVSTPQAISALQVHAEQDVYVAQEPEQYAAAVLRLLASPQEQDRLGKAGRLYVERHHHWASIVQQLETYYLRTIESIPGVML
jgi:sugar transferase (PEP-CTERM/EpsH1 system associated)